MTGWRSILERRRKTRGPATDVAGLLSRVPIFSGLNRRELASVEKILHRRQYAQDEIVFRQGEPGMGMYIVQTGVVAIVSEPHDQPLAELKDGDFFGELALLDESPRSATAVARTACRMFGFFLPDLAGLLERDPRLGLKIILPLARHLGERLRRTNARLDALAARLDSPDRSAPPPAGRAHR